MPSGYILTNSYFSLTYYYSDKENKYRIPYQNKYDNAYDARASITRR